MNFSQLANALSRPELL